MKNSWNVAYPLRKKNFMSKFSANFVVANSNGPGTFSITGTKLKVIQNYCSNWNPDPKAQLTTINGNQKSHCKNKTNTYIT